MTRIKYSELEISKIGQRIKECRKVKHYSQKELADTLHKKKDVIRRIETGELKTIDTDLIIRIANCLQCNSDYLLLKTSRYESTDPSSHYLEYPDSQRSADGFVYNHSQFRNDIEYMSQYMHKAYQEQILELVHTVVMMHKVAVSFPHVSKDTAKQFSPSNAINEIEKNFFESNT